MQTASEADVAQGCARPPDICCRRREQSNGFPQSGSGAAFPSSRRPTPHSGGSKRITILPLSGHFEGLSGRQDEMVVTITVAVVRYAGTRKGMTRNDLHYLAAATMFGDQVAGGCRAPEFLR